MPCISENIICVTVPELEKCGMKINTIKTNLKQQRQNLVYCWQCRLYSLQQSKRQVQESYTKRTLRGIINRGMDKIKHDSRITSPRSTR